MLAIGIVYFDLREGSEGVLLVSDRNIFSGRRLLYEGNNIVEVSEKPAVALAFPGLNTAIQTDFMLRMMGFIRFKEITDYIGFVNEFPTLYKQFTAMSDFYTQASSSDARMLDFLIGISDEEGKAGLYYVSIGKPVEFEMLGEYANFAVTTYGQGEIGLFIREAIKEAINLIGRENEIITLDSALGISISALQIAEKLYRDISPNIDICTLLKGKINFLPKDEIDRLYSITDAQRDAVFQLLYDFLHYPERYNVGNIIDTIKKGVK